MPQKHMRPSIYLPPSFSIRSLRPVCHQNHDFRTGCCSLILQCGQSSVILPNVGSSSGAECSYMRPCRSGLSPTRDCSNLRWQLDTLSSHPMFAFIRLRCLQTSTTARIF